MAGVAGVVIAIGSCLRWLTVTGPFTGPIAVDKSSGLHDLGYATGGPIAIGDLTLVFGLLVLVIAVAPRRQRPSLRPMEVVALSSAAALLAALVAAWLILHHEATRPPGVNLDFHTGAGIWITAGGAAVGLASAAVGIAQTTRADAPTQ
jgi:hypothetical protein